MGHTRTFQPAAGTDERRFVTPGHVEAGARRAVRLAMDPNAGAGGFTPPSPLSLGPMALQLRPPVEYLKQGEGHEAPPRSGFRLGYPVHAERGFTLCGHRLSSLYRNSTRSALTLSLRYSVPSPCRKYSTGVRGCETPAPGAAKE